MIVSQNEIMSIPGSQVEDGFVLLCALASAELSGEQIERIADWDFTAVDWQEFIRLAEHHGIIPLAARNLIEHARGLPEGIEATLRSSYELNLKRGLWFAAELARIVRNLDLQGVPVMPFKGPVLAQSVYGDPGLRSFADLDLMISSADFERAKHILAEIGYRPAKELRPAVERFWLRNGYEQSFDGAAGRNLVELQWALLPHFYAVGLNVEDLLARCGYAVVGDCRMRCLSPEDSVIVLSLHAAKHLWGRLIWLVDIAETLRNRTIDYESVLLLARDIGVGRILGVTFWLVKNVLLADLPEAAERTIAADPSVPALGQEFAERMARAATYDFASTQYFRLILKLRERRSDRLRYLWRLLCTPGEGDIAVLRLPEALFPLYRVVRMARLMQKILSRRDTKFADLSAH
jgi:putative nucleotidyltransferase-like protein